MTNVATNHPVTIQIEGNISSSADATSALKAVFETQHVKERLEKYFVPNFDTTGDWQSELGNVVGPIGTLEGKPVFHYQKDKSVSIARAIERNISSSADKAKQERKVGRSTLYFIVDEHGQIALLSFKDFSGNVFDFNALEAVSRWKFRPAENDGKPVAFMSTVDISYQFR